MGRVNIEELRKEEELRDKPYVWKKPLIIGGKVIKPTHKHKERRSKKNA